MKQQDYNDVLRHKIKKLSKISGIVWFGIWDDASDCISKPVASVKPDDDENDYVKLKGIIFLV
jgi:hypothetical protein